MSKLNAKDVIEFTKDKDLIDEFLQNKENYLTNFEQKETKQQLAYLISLEKKWQHNSVIYNSLGYEFSLINKAILPIKNKIGSNGNGSNKNNLELKVETPEIIIGAEAKAEPKAESEAESEKQPNQEIQIPGDQEDRKQLQNFQRKATLEDLLKYYKYKGVVGEKSTCILQTLGAIHKLYFGVESLSGSGKSFVVEALMDLLPEEDVYKMELSSNTAEIYEASEINKKKIIYIPELQKALRSNNPIIIEVIKNITEGKDVSRKVRDNANKRNLKFTIKGDKGIIYTLAYENQFKKDTELSRRVFQLYTDISENQTKKILEAIAKQQWDSKAEAMQEEDIEKLKSHIKECLHLPKLQYINPFSETIIENFPLNIKARSFIKHYFNLIQACTKYCHKKRIISDSKIFVNLEDIYMIHKTYGKEFLKTVLKLPMIGEKILTIFDSFSDVEKIQEISNYDIFEKVREKKLPLNFELVNDSLEQLANAGFLEKTGKAYRKIKSYDYKNNFDWKKCWQVGTKIMQENYPNLAEEWKARQFSDNKLLVYDPLLNEKKVLLETETAKEGKKENE